MNPVYVIGCCGSGFSEEAREILRGAELVFGGKRLLAAAAPLLPEKAECVELGAGLVDALERGLAARGRRRTAVLASGDPLCCGIGGTLRRIAPGAELRFLPSPTAFQLFFARLGEPWERARFFSLHGDAASLPFRALLRSPLAVVYGDAKRSARAIAAELVERFPAAAGRRAAAGCNLGLDGEYIAAGTLESVAADAAAECSLSMLALLPDRTAPVPELPLGLPDGTYRHSKNMITHPEVRAIVLAKLRPVPGVLWDLGAGSGAVGLEAAGLCPELEVHAVERNPERLAELEANFRHEGLRNLHAHAGSAPDRIPELPEPDRVFVGGGGRELPEILAAAFARLRPGGVLVATAVLAESAAALVNALAPYRCELLTVNISRGEPLGGQTLLRAENPITIAVYRKPEKETRLS